MERFRNYLKIELGQKIASLDQQDLETPNVLDLNQRAQSALEDGQGVWVLIYGVIYFFEKLFVLVGCISIIFTLNWLFIVILILPVLVGILAEYIWEKSNKKNSKYSSTDLEKINLFNEYFDTISIWERHTVI